jgi:hypothetical protein
MKSLVFLSFLLMSGVATAADIVGTIQQKSGKPIAGATVKIYTAGMRSGDSPYCPSCWADCEKSGDTDAKGAFRIANVNDKLVFRLLVLAKGYAPTFVTKVDPQNGPATATLEPRDLSSFQSEQLLQGRVLGPDHQPIAGASVSPEYRQTGLDPMTVTDAEGCFVLTCPKPVRNNLLRICAEGYACLNIRSSIKNKEPQEVEATLSRGVTLSGRVLDHGKPVAGVTVGAVQLDRTIESFLGDLQAVTREDGSFEIRNAPAKEKMVVYGVMESVKAYGALPIKAIKTGENESRLQVGDLTVQPAKSLAGHFRLPDGKPFPEGARITIGRELAWDLQMVAVAPDGAFSADGFPEGEVLELAAPRDHHIQKLNYPLTVDELSEEVRIRQPGDLKDLEITLVWKDANTKFVEAGRKIVADHYQEFFDAEKLPTEKITSFIIAKRKHWDDALKWEDNGQPSWKAAMEEGERQFVSEMKSLLGEPVLARYQEFEDQAPGRAIVNDLLKRHPGDWLTPEEHRALVVSLMTAIKEYRKTAAANTPDNPTMEERIKEHDAETKLIIDASTEVLPAAKVAIIKEIMEVEKKQWLEAVRTGEEK